MLLAGGQPCSTVAGAGQAEELTFGEHSFLLTLVTHQIICATSTHWDLFPHQPSGHMTKRKLSTGTPVNSGAVIPLCLVLPVKIVLF
jgi:hypothetical protein